MDKMDTKLDRREDQYRPRVYQTTMVLETDHIVETGIKITIGEEETTA